MKGKGGEFLRKRVGVALVVLFVFGFVSLIVGQEKEKKADEDRKLREEILAVYKIEGGGGLRKFLKLNKDKISNKFIVNFANLGLKERKEEWLDLCKILADEGNDEKTVAEVLYKKGKYYSAISKYKKAIACFDQAHPIFFKIKEWLRVGSVYLSKGQIDYYKGKNSSALEMYSKALPYIEKSGDSRGLGNLYMLRGDILVQIGQFPGALKLFNKSLFYFNKTGSSVGKGEIYNRMGEIHLKNAQYKAAEEMYNNALRNFEKRNDMVGLGNVYYGKGLLYYLTSKNSEALEMYNKALTCYERIGDLLGQGNVYVTKGDIFFRMSKLLPALKMYDKAVSLFEKAGTTPSLGNAYKGKGDVYSHMYDFSNALKMFDKALVIFRQNKNPISLGNVYKSKGEVYAHLGENEEALMVFNSAIQNFKNGNHFLGLANVYEMMGEVYSMKGENIKTLEFYDKAQFLFMNVGDSIGLGNVHVSKGLHFIKLGKYLKAIMMYEKALVYYKKNEAPLGQGNVYNGMGDIFYYTGDYPRALKMYDKALFFFKQNGELLGQGNVCLSKGKTYLRIKNEARALEMLNDALILFGKAEDSQGLGNVLLFKGETLFSNGNFPEALKTYDKALLFFEKKGDIIGKANVFLLKGSVFFETGDILKALAMSEKSLEIFMESGVMISTSLALHGKAKVLDKYGQKERAVELFKKSITMLEKVRFQTAYSEMKKKIMRRAYPLYEDSVLYMLGNRFNLDAFEYVGLMKARVFLDKVVEGFVELTKGLDSELKKNRDKLILKLSTLIKNMHRATRNKNREKLPIAKEKYRAAQKEFFNLMLKIRLKNPLYSSIRYPQAIDVQTVQRDVLKKNETLVLYFISPKKIYAFLISKENYEVVPLGITEKEINALVKTYLRAFKENNYRHILKYSRHLYRILVKPLEQDKNNNTQLIIIPDGILERIPFESFVTGLDEEGNPRFFLESYRIKYIQSASVLSVLRKHYQRNSTTRTFIGFGDPVYDYENFKQGKPEKRAVVRGGDKNDEIAGIFRSRYARAGGILGRLPDSGKEIQTIASLFSEFNYPSSVYPRDQATEDRAKAADMKNYDYIHFACHGLLNDQFQSLVLSQDIPGAKEDGYFTLNEILNCDYNAKMIVLSACQTGSGKLERGEGVTGLTRAVMYAGTPCVVASLWDVDDNATKELMVHFYRNILEKNMDKSEALRQAKLELMKDERYRSPLFWSGFVMYGE